MVGEGLPYTPGQSVAVCILPGAPTFCIGALVSQEGFLAEREEAMAPCPAEDPVVL